MNTNQETGRHPQQTAKEPFPHRENSKGEGKQPGGGGESQRGDGSERREPQQSGSENESLKSKEYKNVQGNTGHRTRPSEEQQRSETRR